MKRDIFKEKEYPSFKTEVENVIVPTYFYPINSAIFIENTEKQDQMVVMNDRP